MHVETSSFMHFVSTFYLDIMARESLTACTSCCCRTSEKPRAEKISREEKFSFTFSTPLKNPHRF